MEVSDWAALDFEDFFRVAVGRDCSAKLRDTLQKARDAGGTDRMLRMAVCAGANIAANCPDLDTETEIAEAARRMWRQGIR